jgi:hypothetical protein
MKPVDIALVPRLQRPAISLTVALVLTAATAAAALHAGFRLKAQKQLAYAAETAREAQAARIRALESAAPAYQQDALRHVPALPIQRALGALESAAGVDGIRVVKVSMDVKKSQLFSEVAVQDTGALVKYLAKLHKTEDEAGWQLVKFEDSSTVEVLDQAGKPVMMLPPPPMSSMGLPPLTLPTGQLLSKSSSGQLARLQWKSAVDGSVLMSK